MLLDKTVEIRWNPKSKQHYEGLGYKFTKCNETLVIPIQHLQPESEMKVSIQCDKCMEVFTRTYATYNKCKKGDLYYCKSCSSRENRKIRAKKEIANGTTLSFEAWARANNRENLLDFWDYELNELEPNQISHSSRQRFYFKCSKNQHASHLRSINSLIVDKATTVYCAQCNSFAQYLLDNFGENGLFLYWGEKNTISPWDITRRSEAKIYAKCLEKDFHGEYEISPSNFVGGRRCSFCSNKKVHPSDSFAQFGINQLGENFLDKYWDYEKNIDIGIDPYKIKPQANILAHFKCDKAEYHGSYQTMVYSFTLGTRCPFCHMTKVHPADSIAARHSESIRLWSTKNSLSPSSCASHGHTEVYWVCENGFHEDYMRSLAQSVKLEFRCPECVRERRESFLQEKVRLYLTETLGYDVLHERECTILPINPQTGRGLPFDNEVVDLRLIIEVQGYQHDAVCLFHKQAAKTNNTTPEHELLKLQQRDKIKKHYALRHGYHFLEISHLDEKNDHYKQVIDAKIESILADTTYAAI